MDAYLPLCVGLAITFDPTFNFGTTEDKLQPMGDPELRLRL